MALIRICSQAPTLDAGRYEVRELAPFDAAQLVRTAHDNGALQSQVRLNVAATAMGRMAGRRIATNPVREVPGPTDTEVLIEMRLIDRDAGGLGAIDYRYLGYTVRA